MRMEITLGDKDALGSDVATALHLIANELASCPVTPLAKGDTGIIKTPREGYTIKGTYRPADTPIGTWTVKAR